MKYSDSFQVSPRPHCVMMTHTFTNSQQSVAARNMSIWKEFRADYDFGLDNEFNVWLCMCFYVIWRCLVIHPAGLQRNPISSLCPKRNINESTSVSQQKFYDYSNNIRTLKWLFKKCHRELCPIPSHYIFWVKCLSCSFLRNVTLLCADWPSLDVSDGADVALRSSQRLTLKWWSISPTPSQPLLSLPVLHFSLSLQREWHVLWEGVCDRGS